MCVYTTQNLSYLPVGQWTTIATIDVNSCKNLRVDFGKSYFIDSNNYMTCIDGASSTGGMVRLKYATGELQAYSATLANIRPVVYVTYNK